MFLPLKDENPTYNKPIVTVSLIVINTLVYFYSASLGSRGFQIFIYKYGLIPVELLTQVELTPDFSTPILLTPLTSMFLHGGLLHLAGNMLYLWIFGNERVYYLM